MSTFAPVDEVRQAKARKKERQAFYTPLSLVDRMLEEAGVFAGAMVLEPSAGDGRIVHRLLEVGAVVHACEIDEGMYARNAGMGAVMIGRDFLSCRSSHRYGRIVMNPPFNRGQDKKHIEHAYSMLDPDGVLIAIATDTFGNDVRRGNASFPGSQCVEVEDLPRELWKETGASPKTVMLTIHGSGPWTEVEGFKNLATFNAAMTVTTDSKLWMEAVRDPGPDDLRSIAAESLRSQGVTPYGIDWVEVSAYVMRLAPSPEPRAGTGEVEGG